MILIILRALIRVGWRTSITTDPPTRLGSAATAETWPRLHTSVHCYCALSSRALQLSSRIHFRRRLSRGAKGCRCVVSHYNRVACTVEDFRLHFDTCVVDSYPIVCALRNKLRTTHCPPPDCITLRNSRQTHTTAYMMTCTDTCAYL